MVTLIFLLSDTEVPGRPRNVEAHAVSAEQIELAWEPPANANTVRIQGYAVRLVSHCSYRKPSIETTRKMCANVRVVCASDTAQARRVPFGRWQSMVLMRMLSP